MKKFIAFLLLASIAFCSLNTESQASPASKNGTSVTQISTKHKHHVVNHHKKKHHRKHRKN